MENWQIEYVVMCDRYGMICNAKEKKVVVEKVPHENASTLMY